MRITDLTQSIHSTMPVFPGTEQPLILKANTLAMDGFLEAKITSAGYCLEEEEV